MPLMAAQWWQMRKSRTTWTAESRPHPKGCESGGFGIYARSAILIVVRIVDMIRPWVRWQPAMLCTSVTCTFCE